VCLYINTNGADVKPILNVKGYSIDILAFIMKTLVQISFHLLGKQSIERGEHIMKHINEMYPKNLTFIKG